LIDSKDNIIAGNGRQSAAQKLRLEIATAIVMDHLSEIKKRAFADNSATDSKRACLFRLHYNQLKRILKIMIPTHSQHRVGSSPYTRMQEQRPVSIADRTF
jgi:hypothetical protein